MCIKELPLKFVSRKDNNFTEARLGGEIWSSDVSTHMASVTVLGFVLFFSDSETIVAYNSIWEHFTDVLLLLMLMEA